MYKNSLFKIAQDCRTKKENGEFDTYRNAYRAVIRDNRAITIKKLENAYYKSIRRLKVKKNIVSIPIMITQEMRMRLRALKYSLSDIRFFTPKQAHEIIKNQIINKNPSLNHGRNQ
tara:strand:- start:227 stop:574 length:348 start_codon:yes stop_codon:yes gene_type:complete